MFHKFTFNLPVLLLCTMLSLFNYTFAVYIAKFFSINTTLNILFLSLVWILIALLFNLYYKNSGFGFNLNEITKNKYKIALIYLITLVGLLVFVLADLTRFFNNVRYPFFFFLVTPLVEELIFRGFIYSRFKSPFLAIFISSLLFSFHHFQYSNYTLTQFIIFQMGYTFLLGILLALIRKYSGSIWIGLLLHVLLNFFSYKI